MGNGRKVGKDEFLSPKEAYELKGRECGFETPEAFFMALLANRATTRKEDENIYVKVDSVYQIAEVLPWPRKYITTKRAYKNVGIAKGYETLDAFEEKLSEMDLMMQDKSEILKDNAVKYMKTQDMKKVPDHGLENGVVSKRKIKPIEKEESETLLDRSYISELFELFGKELGYETSKGFGSAIHYAGIEIQGKRGKRHISNDDIVRIPAFGELNYKKITANAPISKLKKPDKRKVSPIQDYRIDDEELLALRYLVRDIIEETLHEVFTATLHNKRKNGKLRKAAYEL